MTTLPVDLLLATHLHEIAEKSENVPEAIRRSVLGDPRLAESIERDLLLRISLQAPHAAVRAALTAAGVAETGAELRARLDAVLEQRRSAATSTPHGGR